MHVKITNNVGGTKLNPRNIVDSDHSEYSLSDGESDLENSKFDPLVAIQAAGISIEHDMISGSGSSSLLSLKSTNEIKSGNPSHTSKHSLVTGLASSKALTASGSLFGESDSEDDGIFNATKNLWDGVEL